MVSLVNSTKDLKKSQHQLFSNSSKKNKIEKEQTFPNSFYEAGITLIPKQIKQRHYRKTKLQDNIPEEHR